MRYLAAFLLSIFLAAPSHAFGEAVHGLALHGEPKYGPDFKHLDYVNPNAPKGGLVRLAAIGTFDSLNPFILKGVPAAGVAATFDTLLSSTGDEAFTEYGLIAEKIEKAGDSSYVIFHLNPKARFHDGSKVTADDVVFTFNALRTKGHPVYRSYYGAVEKVTALDELRVRFDFKDKNNRELPLIVGQMPVLSKNYYAKVDFDKTTLTPPLGSGPYRVKEVNQGRSITLERVDNYWAKDLPIVKGRNNFNLIRYDYYRDGTVAIEAFKAGEYDFRQENIAKEWATAYNFPALHAGLVKKEEIPHQIPTGMQGFVMNTRRAIFADAKVREALDYAFDFEWTNKNLFYGAYTRTQSYFSNSELAAQDLPGAEEIKLLEKWRNILPPEVFTQAYQAPKTDGSGYLRDNLKRAQELLREAGWEIVNQKLQKNGKPFTFEILIDNPSFERVTLPYIRNLERLGITARLRTVDTAQYKNRMDQFDFDMTVVVWGQSLSPGNEQWNFWGSAAADTKGSDNYAGIKSPAVDGLIKEIVNAQTREELITRVRALDRVLLWGHYVIPHWHIRSFRVAYWDKFARPAISPKYALGFPDTWWLDQEKAAKAIPPKNQKSSHSGWWIGLGVVGLGLLYWFWRKKK
ncbi:MAG: extracellular solute-binding protein [Dongiaceae bacterium]